MDNYLKSTKTMIEEKYDSFTQVEKVIADYFLHGTIEDFSSKAVASTIYVSEASLSRFSKKLGFSGYREFVFSFNANMKENKRLDQLTSFSIHKYQEVLEQTYQIVDNNQIIRIAKLLDSKKRVFIYGIGSSGLVAKEFASRLIRLGLDAEAINSESDITANSPRVQSESLVIGISISGSNPNVIAGLKRAHEKNATTVLMTSMQRAYHDDIIDEIVKVAHVKNVTVSHIISAEFPALVMTDIIYTHYLNYNKSDKQAKNLQEVLREEGILIEIFKADVSKRNEVKEMVKFALEKWGKLDVLINNAGIAKLQMFQDVTENNWNEIIDTNLKSAFYMSQEVVPNMIHNKNGLIINISSMWGQVGASCETVYSISKAGMDALTKSLAKELGPSNIRVNSIAPGVIDTEMNSKLDEQINQEIKNEPPIKKIGKTTDINRCVKWLIEDEFTTGQVISVNGGYVIT